MALPTTNLTFHVDASDTDHIWKTWQSTTPYHTGVPANNDLIQVWEDDSGLDLAFLAGVDLTWRSSTPLMQMPCLDCDGTNDFLILYNLAGTTEKALSTAIAASAFVVVGSIYVEGVTTNDASIWLNEALLADTTDAGTNGGVWGVHFKNSSGTYSINFYNYDGNVDVLSTNISLNTSYVFAYWHTGGSIYYELYDSSGLNASGNTASGDTAALTYPLNLGRSFGSQATSKYYNGRVGELAFYNAYVSTDKSNAVQYFRDKWFPAAAAPRRKSIFIRQAVDRASTY